MAKNKNKQSGSNQNNRGGASMTNMDMQNVNENSKMDNKKGSTNKTGNQSASGNFK